MGLEATAEEFYGSRSWGARLLLHVAVAALGACLLWRAPLATVLLGLIALLSLELEGTTRFLLLSRPFMRSLSRNVVARIPSASPPRLRILLCGHYDSQKGGWIWTVRKPFAALAGRLPPALQPPFWPLRIALYAQVLAGIGAFRGGAHPIVTVVGVLVLASHAVHGILLGNWATGRDLPGAADNASGTAAALTLGEAWTRNPVDGVEALLLLTGCEETGLLGASAWLDRHAAELRDVPTFFLNLDSFGFGPPRFLGWEVPALGRPLPNPKWVVRMAARVAAERGLEDAGPHAVPGPTDGLAFLARGIPGVTVASFLEGKVFPHYHEPGDTVENMDMDAAWAAVEFADALMQRLADDEWERGRTEMGNEGDETPPLYHP
jgi:hypothetical protein